MHEEVEDKEALGHRNQKKKDGARIRVDADVVLDAAEDGERHAHEKPGDVP